MYSRQFQSPRGTSMYRIKGPPNVSIRIKGPPNVSIAPKLGQRLRPISSSAETSPYLCPPPHGLQRRRLVPKWRHLWLNLCFLVGRKNEISLVLDNIFTKDGYPINPRVSSYLRRPKTCTKVTYFEYKI